MNFVILQPNGRFTAGVPPIFVEADKLCSDCGKVHDFEKCPRCGSWIHIWYGVQGLIHTCTSEGCSWSFVICDFDVSADLAGNTTTARSSGSDHGM